MPALTTGSRVKIADAFARKTDEGVVYVIERVNDKTYTLQPERGGRGVRASHYMVEPVTEPDGKIAATLVSAFDPPPLFDLGEVVEFTGRSANKYKGKYVVLAQAADGKLRCAKLGGDNGRYVRGVHHSQVIRSEAV
jgi:hypothetical protein